MPHVILTPVLFFLRVDFHCLKIFVRSLSEVQLLHLHMTFHTLPLFTHLKVTRIEFIVSLYARGQLDQQERVGVLGE